MFDRFDYERSFHTIDLQGAFKKCEALIPLQILKPETTML